MKKNILNFIKTVEKLIEIGFDYPMFMDDMSENVFTLEFMGVKTSIPFGADEWSELYNCLNAIAEDCVD